MTDMVSGEVASPSTQSIPAQSSPSVQETPQQASEERLLRQSEVNEIVGSAKHEAVERYKRQQAQQTQQPTERVNLSQTHAQNYSQDEIRRVAAEEAQRLRDQWVQDTQRANDEQQARSFAQSFYSKLAAGKEKYDDFDSVMSNVKFDKMPDIAQLAHSVDNTDDVMYDLIKNPTKIGNLRSLINIDPDLAYREITRLSQSIKENAQAQNYKSPNAPLSQVRPSNTGAEKLGANSVRDYRSRYKR